MNFETLKEGFETLRAVTTYLVEHYNAKKEEIMRQKAALLTVRSDLDGVLQHLYKAESEITERLSRDTKTKTDDPDVIVIVSEDEDRVSVAYDPRIVRVVHDDSEGESEEDDEVFNPPEDTRRVIIRKRKYDDDDVDSCPGDVKRAREDADEVS